LGSQVFQEVEIRRARPIRVAFGFGTWGTVSFSCTEVSADARDFTVIARGKGRWDYFDFNDQLPVDFADPFA
jgi:hypothetical protein